MFRSFFFIHFFLHFSPKKIFFLTMKHLSTLREKGHVEVGLQRQSSPIKIYYEMHGNGPEKVLLVMGKV